jgi:hypothetical protein
MRSPTLALLLTALALAGCDSGGDAETEAEPAAGAAGAAEAPAPATPVADLPDTTAAAVWAYLQEVGYADDWELWPGKGRLYEGTEPHGMLLTTYLNGTAYEGLTGGTGPLPAGSIVVKENYTPDSTLAAVTVMYSREGYDPEHDDWFWAKYGPDGAAEAAGRVESCQSCHSAGDRGFLRTALEEPGDGGGP